MRTELTTLLLLSFAVGCAAQQPPPVGTTDAGSPAQQTPPPKAGAKQQSAAGQDKSKQPPADAPDTPAEPESPKPQKSRLAPPSTLYIDAGYGDWGLSGNASKLRQYATPPHGLFLRNLRYSPILRTPSTSAFFDVKGLGQDDYRAETRLVWGYGETLASAFSSRFRFLDPLANQVGSSSRLVQGFKGSQALARDFALSFQYRFDTQHNNYAAPFDNLNQETQFWDASAAGKLGRGFGAVTFSDLQYADHTGSRLDSTTQTVALSYLWNLSSAVDVEAEYRHAGIRQPSLSDSHVEVVSLKGDVALGPSTDLNVRLQQRNLALPNVQSAYVRGQGLGMASLFHRWKSWRAQVGVRLQEDERVNASHTFVDVPKWSTVEGRLSGRLLDGWRLTLRGYAQTLSDPPVAATDDPASLYWTSRNFFEARLEGGPPDISYYLVYTFQNNRNSARMTEVQTSQFTLGSTWQLTPTLNLFGEFHHESWTGHTDFDTGPTLNNFLPDSTTGVVELTWNQRRLFLSASYTGFTEHNDNPLLLQDGNAEGNFVTLSGRYRFPRGYELGLTVSPWYYRDKVVSALDYSAAVVMVTGSARF